VEEIANFKARIKQGVEEKSTIEAILIDLMELFTLKDYGAQLKEIYKKVTEKDSLSYQEVHCSALSAAPVCPKNADSNPRWKNLCRVASSVLFPPWRPSEKN